jgi:hypothetical protein
MLTRADLEQGITRPSSPATSTRGAGRAIEERPRIHSSPDPDAIVADGKETSIRIWQVMIKINGIFLSNIT